MGELLVMAALEGRRRWLGDLRASKEHVPEDLKALATRKRVAALPKVAAAQRVAIEILVE